MTDKALTDKERLVELIKQSADYAIKACNSAAGCKDCIYDKLHRTDCHANFRADYLIANNIVEQKQGEWLISSDGYYPYCSECKNVPKGGNMTDFCPSCGAEMVKEKDDAK